MCRNFLVCIAPSIDHASYIPMLVHGSVRWSVWPSFSQLAIFGVLRKVAEFQFFRSRAVQTALIIRQMILDTEVTGNALTCFASFKEFTDVISEYWEWLGNGCNSFVVWMENLPLGICSGHVMIFNPIDWRLISLHGRLKERIEMTGEKVNRVWKKEPPSAEHGVFTSMNRVETV